MPTNREVVDYIIKSAQARGIDPNTAVKVWSKEGKGAIDYQSGVYNKKGLREPSYGPFQLLVGGKGTGFPAGLGNRAPFNARDPKTWKENIDFALDEAKRDGWRQWYGAANAGIGRWSGIGSRDPNPTNTRPPKSINLGATPQLTQLKPSPHIINTPKGDIPLSQLAPTEQSSTMARHPSFEDAIKKSLKEQGVQVAGVVLPNIRPPGNKGRFAKDPRADSVVRDRLPKPEDRPGPRTPTVNQQEQRAREDYAKQQEMKARIQRGENPSPDTGSGPVITPPAPKAGTVPAAANTNVVPGGSKLPNAGNAVGAAGVGTAASAIGAGSTALPGAADPNDSALMQVYKMIMGGGGAKPAGDVVAPPPIDDTGGLGIPPQPVGPQPVTAGASPSRIPGNAPGDNLTIEHLIAQGIPTIKEALKDPTTAAATKQVIQKVVQTKAHQDARQADMMKDPTFYQRRASQVTPSGQPADPSDPMYERRMMDAVARDQNNSMRGRSTPQTIPARQSARQQAPVPSQQQQPVEQGDQGDPALAAVQQKMQVLPPRVAQEGPNAPYPTAPLAGPIPHGFNNYKGSTLEQGVPAGYRAPPESAVNVGYPQAPIPQMTPQMMDPTMMHLMQFFTGGGGGATE